MNAGITDPIHPMQGDIAVLLGQNEIWQSTKPLFAKKGEEKMMIKLLPDGRWFKVDDPALRTFEERYGFKRDSATARRVERALEGK